MNDRTLRLPTGWTGLLALLAGLGIIVLLIVVCAITQMPVLLWIIIPLILTWVVCLFGFIVVNPNQACVVQLFGNYLGTITDVGFYYGNPFYWRTKVSLRVRTFETGVQESEEVKDAMGKVVKQASQSRRPIKVNDKDGTPIEIAAVVVWKVVDAAQAVFQVDDYDSYVHTQADAALRNLASHYRYDAPEDDESSLRGHIDLVAEKLKVELHSRMHQAGVEMLDARISYLAYAPEIAGKTNEGELAIHRFRVPAGMKTNLWAAEPALANPVCFAFDERGRVFVAETFRQQKGVVDNRNFMHCSNFVSYPAQILRLNLCRREQSGEFCERLFLSRRTDCCATDDPCLFAKLCTIHQI